MTVMRSPDQDSARDGLEAWAAKAFYVQSVVTQVGLCLPFEVSRWTSVSKSWYQKFSGEHVWRSIFKRGLSFRRLEIEAYHVHGVSRRMPHLLRWLSLDFLDCVFSEQAAMDLWKLLPGCLHHLSLHFTGPRDDSVLFYYEKEKEDDSVLQVLGDHLPNALLSLTLNLSCHGYGITAAGLQSLANYLPNSLEKFTLSLPPDDDDFFDNSRKKKAARKKMMAAWRALFQNLPRNLRHFELHRHTCDFDASVLRMLSEHLPSSLQHLLLDFFGCNLKEGATVLAACIPRSLQHLTLIVDQCDIKITGALALVEQLPVGLIDLDLTFANLDDEIDSQLTKSLAKNLPRNLRRLRLIFDSHGLFEAFNEDVISPLAARLPSTLQDLHLSIAGFGAAYGADGEGVRALAKNLPQGLQKLEIHFMTDVVRDEEVEVLAKALPSGLRHLKLDVCNCGIHARGVWALSEHLPSGLQDFSLRLGSCDLGEQGASAVGAVLQNLPKKLKTLELDLSETGIGEHGVRIVGENLPENLTRVNLTLFQLEVGARTAKSFVKGLPRTLLYIRIMFRSLGQVQHALETVCASTCVYAEEIEIYF